MERLGNWNQFGNTKTFDYTKYEKRGIQKWYVLERQSLSTQSITLSLCSLSMFIAMAPLYIIRAGAARAAQRLCTEHLIIRCRTVASRMSRTAASSTHMQVLTPLGTLHMVTPERFKVLTDCSTFLLVPDHQLIADPFIKTSARSIASFLLLHRVSLRIWFDALLLSVR